MKQPVQGVRATASYLQVLTTIDYGSAIRFQTVRVPWFMLCTQEVIEGIDRETRRALLEAWADDDPLPGIG